MKSSLLFGLFAAGYVFFFLLALLEMGGTSVFYPADFWFCMAGCALAGIIFGRSEQQWIATAALIFALVMGIYCWHHNRPIHQRILEIQQRDRNDTAPQFTNTN